MNFRSSPSENRCTGAKTSEAPVKIGIGWARCAGKMIFVSTSAIIITAMNTMAMG